MLVICTIPVGFCKNLRRIFKKVRRTFSVVADIFADIVLTPPALFGKILIRFGSLAQLVEQWTVNPCVAGSSPAGAAKTSSFGGVFFYVLWNRR